VFLLSKIVTIIIGGDQMDISKILGASYFSLEAAAVDKSPEEVVVTENDSKYYIVSLESYEKALQPLNYKIVVHSGE
jgi:hypothetical protein